MSKRKAYPPEFKKESASLVLDQDYSITEACEAVNVGSTAMRRWVKQLQLEREGKTPENATAITVEHREIQALKSRIKRLEREKEILKKASALLMTDSFNV